jgi:CubicO group peptidase (beta-lactamase class C family)
VIRGDSVTEQAAFGTTSTENGRAVTVDDRFHWGSVSKRFAATLIAHLVQHGELSYGKRLREMLPRVRMHQAYEQTTIRDLLVHRAGLICFPPLDSRTRRPHRSCGTTSRTTTTGRRSNARR